MRLKKALRHKIEQELELHFHFTHRLYQVEREKLVKDVSELDKNLSINAKVQNLLNLAKSTRDNLEKTTSMLSQIEDEAQGAGFKDLSRERLEKVSRSYVEDDDFFERRLVLALKFIFSLPLEVSNTSKKEVFKELSLRLAFPSDSTLTELEKSVKKNYKDISLTNKVSSEELLKVGLVSSVLVAGILSIATLPLIGLGTGATLGGGLVSSLVTTTSISLVSGIGAAGIAYVVKTHTNEQKILDEFINLTPDELAYMLTFNATIVEQMRKLGVKAESSAIRKRLDIFVKLQNQINVDYYLKQQELEVNTQKKKIIAKCDQILQASV